MLLIGCSIATVLIAAVGAWGHPTPSRFALTHAFVQNLVGVGRHRVEHGRQAGGTRLMLREKAPSR